MHDTPTADCGESRRAANRAADAEGAPALALQPGARSRDPRDHAHLVGALHALDGIADERQRSQVRGAKRATLRVVHARETKLTMPDSKTFKPERTGVVPFGEAVSHDGLTLFRRMLDGQIPAPPIAAVMNMTLDAAEQGRVTFASVPDASLLNPLGSVHGGYALALLDSCMACAVHTTLAPGEGYTSVEVKVNFTRALQPEATIVRATGHVLSRGRRIATAEGKLVGDDGKLYAHGTTTCLIFEAGKT